MRKLRAGVVALALGATLVVDSEPGRGTRVRCTLDAH